MVVAYGCYDRDGDDYAVAYTSYAKHSLYSRAIQKLIDINLE